MTVRKANKLLSGDLQSPSMGSFKYWLPLNYGLYSMYIHMPNVRNEQKTTYLCVFFVSALVFFRFLCECVGRILVERALRWILLLCPATECTHVDGSFVKIENKFQTITHTNFCCYFAFAALLQHKIFDHFGGRVYLVAYRISSECGPASPSSEKNAATKTTKMYMNVLTVDRLI